jgi:hypothetical protein
MRAYRVVGSGTEWRVQRLRHFLWLACLPWWETLGELGSHGDDAVFWSRGEATEMVHRIQMEDALANTPTEVVDVPEPDHVKFLRELQDIRRELK